MQEYSRKLELACLNIQQKNGRLKSPIPCTYVYTLRTEFECVDKGRGKRLPTEFTCPREIGKQTRFIELPGQEIEM